MKYVANNAFRLKNDIQDLSIHKQRILNDIISTVEEVPKVSLTIDEVTYYAELMKDYNDMANDLGYSINWVKGVVIKEPIKQSM